MALLVRTPPRTCSPLGRSMHLTPHFSHFSHSYIRHSFSQLTSGLLCVIGHYRLRAWGSKTTKELLAYRVELYKQAKTETHRCFTLDDFVQGEDFVQVQKSKFNNKFYQGPLNLVKITVLSYLIQNQKILALPALFFRFLTCSCSLTLRSALDDSNYHAIL